jgi:RNA polymerase sigma-70 factor (ECF subfamily)
MGDRELPGAGERVPTWDEVVAGEAGFVHSLAYRLTGNAEDAADLAQDVLLKVRAALVRYRAGSLRGWLARITTNLYYDRVRHLARHPLEVFTRAHHPVAGHASGPEEAALAAELQQVVEAALLRLPRNFRVAVVMSDLYGLGYEEIARRTGWPLGTVRSRIHRGRALLGSLLGDYVGAGS